MDDSYSIFEDTAEPATGVSTTSLSLLIRAQLRDNTAWRRLVRLYSPLVCHWCQRDGVAHDDIDDLLQDIFTAVVSALPGFRRSESTGSFRGWLRTICRNKVIDYRRCRNHQVAVTDLENVDDRDLVSPESSAESVEATEERLLFLHALSLIQAEFPPHMWAAFWETSIAGRDPAELALELGVSRNTVYLARSRVLRRLREEFDDLLS